VSAPAAAAAPAREPARSRLRPGNEPGDAERPEAAPLPSLLTLRRCACGGSCPRCRGSALRPKLAINTPGDAFEREADAAAEAVMSASPTAAPSTAAPSPAPPLLRRCACGGGCPSCRKEKEEALQREDAGGGGAPGFAPPVVHDVLSSPGRPLAAPARAFMETRFGADFSGVRVHDDARAAESARAVDAHAYTVGSDIVFAPGRYAPGTAGGDRLLAHELAHVVQQAPRPGHLARKESAQNGMPRLRRMGNARLLQRAECTPDASGKCCFACPKPPSSPPNRCCTKDKFDFVQKSEESGNAISNKAWDRWNVVRDCPADDSRVSQLLMKHFKVDAQAPGTAVPSISGALDKIISVSGIIPDCEPRVAGDTDEAQVSAAWRPLNHAMCIDFFPSFFDKARAARAPITTIHEKAHSLAGKDDRGGYEGDAAYPGPDSATALGNADSVANFIRDLAGLPTAPKCK
jgi:hypothetical protein